MRRLTFSLPFYSIIPIGLGIGSIFALIGIFSLLRFMNCPTWELFKSAPIENAVIIGAWDEQVYLQSSGSPIYCNEKDQWAACSPPVYFLSQTNAPLWFTDSFFNSPENSKVKQLSRMEIFPTTIKYYLLSENGKIWSCTTTFSAEINRSLSSWTAIWLIIPTAIGIWCMVWFMNIFIKTGDPTLWDFFGHGEKIK